MITEIQSLMDEYAAWLKNQTALREVGGHVEITTPFLDRHNDQVQIYARSSDGGLLLTDDGYTIADLQMSGCKLDTTKRRGMLETVLNGFGVRLDGEALVTRATRQTFALRKHNLVQAMLAVNDLFYVASPNVTSLFLEDVSQWLEVSDVRFVPNVKFTGKSGYDHVFDFAIPRSRRSPERIVQAINRPSRETAEVFAFAWIDTKDVRPADSEAFAILNDADKAITPTIVAALESYDIKAIRWSERDTVKERLAA